MKVRELLEHIDSFAPFALSEEWDNPGLMVGSYDAEVSKAAVCLDAVSDAVIAASTRGCEVLVAHHPLIFRPVRKIDTGSEFGLVVSEAVKRNVTIIAAHTNWDKAPGGVNDTLAKLLGLKDARPLGEFGLFGEIETMTTEYFLEHVKASWHLSHLDFYAQVRPERVSRVALCGGAGSEFWRQAKNAGADVYITADMKYHELIDATHEWLAIAAISHGEMERASLPELARKLSGCGIETVILDVNALNTPFRL